MLTTRDDDRRKEERGDVVSGRAMTVVARCLDVRLPI
jgi:hypothetical protein